MKGRIIKSISGEYTVAIENLADVVCKPKGIFRHKNISPKVGDIVEIDLKTKSILEIEDRKNELVRPVIANIDKAFLVFSVKEPDLNLNLLDQMLSVVEYNNIEIIIVFTKLDLLSDKTEFNKIREYYEKVGYTTLLAGKTMPFDDVVKEIAGNVCTFAGQSGVGKSTLLNLVDRNLNIKTQEISMALGRGKHTTRHVELLRVGTGFIADTPGFGKLDFEFEDLLTFSHSFVEFYKNSDKCKYKGCLHVNEPGCYIREMVEKEEVLKNRYDNYLLFMNEIKDKIKNKKY